MDLIFTVTLLCSVLKAAVGFNVESDSWKTLSHSDESFGYQVVQRRSDLLVSAPRLQHENNKTGQIFQCSTDSCRPLFTAEQRAAVNTSLGLVMTLDPSTQNTKACGPTIPRDCKTITMYNGLCYEINRDNTIVKSYPSTTEECRTQADIAFLLDGSGSVANDDFFRMKIFVKNLIRTFLGRDTQFAITQFSGSPTTHYYFNTFSTSNWESQIDNINQLRGGTFTAKAIQNVVDDVFSPQKGSRSNVKRILIVITDGESNDRQNLPAATQSADRKNILRFAIGVGNAFTNTMARQELIAIASQPADNFVFQVGSFDALDRVRETLQDKIDSIEGYSMAVAKTNDGPLTILGAPRNQNKGVVTTVFNEQLRDEIRPSQSQTGEYFGAEVCAMDVDSDGLTDLILISSPMYKDVDREGRVYVCELSRLSVICYFDNPSQITTLRGDASVRGRFGSSLAVLPDINADKFNDLAVGAPLENDGQGSIYIFRGEGGRKINPTHSQRIAASTVESGLKLFGISISQSSYDQSDDGLPDLAVGSKGKVVILRSRPVVTVTATVTFNPNLIPTQNPVCSKPLPSKATVCFIMSKLSNVNEAQAQVNFTLTLDANRKIPNNRAEISKDVRHKSGSLNLFLDREECTNVYFFIKSCPEDALIPLNNELRFTFDGLPSDSNPRPSLSPQVETTTFHPVGFFISNDNNMMSENAREATPEGETLREG
ncbi:integrin alpha-D-like [Gambusia affinis]|uniref:integrin alpha-D-like n=1 Tax=Gambusia affinis TaxID=33528 RepID=UPI001CDB5457|nr:integrin alpha-D-like [Gambusia affinis]